MDLEAKKGILLSIISATEKVEVIEHLITIAWSKEIEKPRVILQKEGKEPSKPRIPKMRAVTIHGQEYRSLRYACIQIWGMEESEYNKVSRQVKEGVDIHDLLAPRREPEPKILPTDSMGVVVNAR